MSVSLETFSLTTEDLLQGESAPNTVDQWAGFSVDKTKVFFELVANISFYFKELVHPKWFPVGFWAASEKAGGSLKTIMSVPSLLKGTMSFCQNYNDGKLFLRKAVADLSFIVSDAVDSVKSIDILALGNISKPTLAQLAWVKNIASSIGLTNSIYENIVKLGAPAKQHKSLQDPSSLKERQLVEIKKRWNVAERKATWDDFFKNVTGLALTGISLAGYSPAVLPWTFAVVGSAGLYGKISNYMHLSEAKFWESRYVNVVTQ